MKRPLLLAAILAGSCPTWGQSAQGIIDALNAAAQAEHARQEAEDRARQEEFDNTVVWACKCVGGSPVYYATTQKQWLAEGRATQARSQALFQAYPNMSLQANMTLANPCGKK